MSLLTTEDTRQQKPLERAARNGTDDRGLASWLSGQVFKPVLASLLENRLAAFMLVGIVALQIGSLLLTDVEVWRCPIKAALGIPCPGCGLSHAGVLLLRGRWQQALHTHAFAPLFLLGFIVILVSGLLPRHLHDRFAAWVAVLERRTGMVAFVLVGLIVYWIVRLSLGML